MGGTYGGNSVSCAAALAVLDIFQEEKILENVKRSETIVRDSLNHLHDPDLVKEVRGKGLMIGIEFNRPSSAQPGWVAKEVSARCAARGLIVLACGPYDTIRLIPPLNIAEDELKEGLKIVDEAITFVADNIKAG
jgi:4-aminobutyrate aminotransferase-like enzyme